MSCAGVAALTYGFLHSTAAPLHILMNGLLLWWIGGRRGAPREPCVRKALRRRADRWRRGGGRGRPRVRLCRGPDSRDWRFWRSPGCSQPSVTCTGTGGSPSSSSSCRKYLLAAVVFIDVVAGSRHRSACPRTSAAWRLALLWMSGRWRPGAWVAMAKRARLKRKLRAVEGGRKGPPTLRSIVSARRRSCDRSERTFFDLWRNLTRGPTTPRASASPTRLL